MHALETRAMSRPKHASRRMHRVYGVRRQRPYRLPPIDRESKDNMAEGVEKTCPCCDAPLEASMEGQALQFCKCCGAALNLVNSKRLKSSTEVCKPFRHPWQRRTTTTTTATNPATSDTTHTCAEDENNACGLSRQKKDVSPLRQQRPLSDDIGCFSEHNSPSRYAIRAALSAIGRVQHTHAPHDHTADGKIKSPCKYEAFQLTQHQHQVLASLREMVARAIHGDTSVFNEMYPHKKRRQRRTRVHEEMAQDPSTEPLVLPSPQAHADAEISLPASSVSPMVTETAAALPSEPPVPVHATDAAGGGDGAAVVEPRDEGNNEETERLEPPHEPAGVDDATAVPAGQVRVHGVLFRSRWDPSSDDQHRPIHEGDERTPTPPPPRPQEVEVLAARVTRMGCAYRVVVTAGHTVESPSCEGHPWRLTVRAWPDKCTAEPTQGGTAGSMVNTTVVEVQEQGSTDSSSTDGYEGGADGGVRGNTIMMHEVLCEEEVVAMVASHTTDTRLYHHWRAWRKKVQKGPLSGCPFCPTGVEGARPTIDKEQASTNPLHSLWRNDLLPLLLQRHMHSSITSAAADRLQAPQLRISRWCWRGGARVAYGKPARWRTQRWPLLATAYVQPGCTGLCFTCYSLRNHVRVTGPLQLTVGPEVLAHLLHKLDGSSSREGGQGHGTQSQSTTRRRSLLEVVRDGDLAWLCGALMARAIVARKRDGGPVLLLIGEPPDEPTIPWEDRPEGTRAGGGSSGSDDVGSVATSVVDQVVRQGVAAASKVNVCDCSSNGARL